MVKKVVINPGMCGNITTVEAVSEDGLEVTVRADSGCVFVRRMFEELGESFDSFALCLNKPGRGPMYAYASENFPSHCGCPILAGIIKAVEVECKLALPRDVSITF